MDSKASAHWEGGLKDGQGNNILVNRLVHEFSLPDRLIDELPIEISKERQSLSGRIDIYVGWDNYSLLIDKF